MVLRERSRLESALKGLVVLLAVALLTATAAAAPLKREAAAYTRGDVLVGVGSGRVDWHRANGTLVRTIVNPRGGSTLGMAFDSGGSLYLATYGPVVKFDANGNSQGTFFTPPDGDIATSLAFDSAGNLFIGTGPWRGSPNPQDVYKVSPAGALLARYDVDLQSFAGDDNPATNGPFWIRLAANQCTLYYASMSAPPRINRFDVCTSTQLPDFDVDVGLNDYFQFELLPDGGIIAAARDEILRISPGGGSSSATTCRAARWERMRGSRSRWLRETTPFGPGTRPPGALTFRTRFWCNDPDDRVGSCRSSLGHQGHFDVAGAEGGHQCGTGAGKATWTGEATEFKDAVARHVRTDAPARHHRRRLEGCRRDARRPKRQRGGVLRREGRGAERLCLRRRHRRLRRATPDRRQLQGLREARGTGARAKKPVRRLWGKGKGSFRTKGRYIAAATRGTWWLTEDFCDRSVVTVKEGAMTVRDLVKKKTVVVKAGKSYVARRSA